jgi:hypothetical protein
VAFFRAALSEAVRAVVSAAEIRLGGALASFADVQVYDGIALRTILDDTTTMSRPEAGSRSRSRRRAPRGRLRNKG